MDELFDRFMRTKEGRLAATTMQRYECLLRLYLRPAVGSKKVTALRSVDLLATYALWGKRKVGARTIRHAAELLRNATASHQMGDHHAQSSCITGCRAFATGVASRVNGAHRVRSAATAPGSIEPNPPVHSVQLPYRL